MKTSNIVSHTEVRWLSRGRTLVWLFELWVSVLEMLREVIKIDHAEAFLNADFQTKLAYLVDIFDQYNNLNMKLQGESANIITCKQAVDAFTRKLSLWSDTRYKGMTTYMFQEFSELFIDRSLTPEMKTVILTHLNALRIEMFKRFEDIADADEYSFVLDPFSAKLEDVPDAEELIEIQSSINKRRYFERQWLC
ncbi:zinc finger protein [Apostichopus japonicus]|uniref:Zinc finger protein n=1 Tax=Stichopus japonicus TaxID=307972 RepID=A0A2G8LF46_STIJA|nr:zinc finger protein [Apostichopus japonicus]